MIIFLNGPPRCGKDTGAQILLRRVPGAVEYKMSWPLKRSIPQMFMLSPEQVAEFEKDKERPRLELGGLSWRETQIWLSEDVIKPKFGHSFFGRIATAYMRHNPTSYHVISDSGFREEALPVVHEFGPEQCRLIQVHRPGTSFAGDSRSWVDLSDVGVRPLKVLNDSTLEVYEHRLLASLRLP